jgi:hypothetical protein
MKHAQRRGVIAMAGSRASPPEGASAAHHAGHQQTVQAELRDIERAVATDTRRARLRTDLRRQAARAELRRAPFRLTFSRPETSIEAVPDAPAIKRRR